MKSYLVLAGLLALAGTTGCRHAMPNQSDANADDGTLSNVDASTAANPEDDLNMAMSEAENDTIDIAGAQAMHDGTAPDPDGNAQR